MITCRGVHATATRGQGNPALFPPAMNTYHIVPVEGGFEIIETYPDDRTAHIGGFQSEADAQAWLDNYRRMRRLNGWPAGKQLPG
jgi:hypothetical protein